MEANQIYEQYLRGLANGNKRYGLMLALKKNTHHEEIIHMSRWPEEDEEDVDRYFHAVNSMLPVGIYICGLFTVGQDLDKEFLEEFKTVHKANSPNSPLKILQYDSSSPYNFKCISLGQDKPIPFTFTDKIGKSAIRIDTFYQFNEIFLFDKYDPNEEFLKVTSRIDVNLDRSMVILNGKHYPGMEKISTVINTEDKENGVVIADFYKKNDLYQSEVKTMENALQLKGNIASRLFVHENDTVENVKHMLKDDLKRTIIQRLDEALFSKSKGIEGPDLVPDLISKMPRRVYFTIQPSNIQLFINAMPDDTEEDLRADIKDLLDIDLEVTDIFLDLDESDPIAKDEFKKDVVADVGTSMENSYITTLIRFLLVFIVALVSILIPFYLIHK